MRCLIVKHARTGSDYDNIRSANYCVFKAITQNPIPGSPVFGDPPPYRRSVPGKRRRCSSTPDGSAIVSCVGRPPDYRAWLQLWDRLVSFHPPGHAHRALVIPLFALRCRDLRSCWRPASRRQTGTSGVGRHPAAVDGVSLRSPPVQYSSRGSSTHRVDCGAKTNWLVLRAPRFSAC